MKGFSVAACLLFAALLAGCFGYTLGTGDALPFRTVALDVPTTDVPVPQARAVLGSNVAEALARDGTVAVVERGRDDARLTINIVGYTRQPRATAANDTGRSASFAVTLTAEVTLLDRRSGEVLLDRVRLETTESALLADSLPEAEYTLMPILAERLADRIRDAVLSTWDDNDDTAAELGVSRDID